MLKASASNDISRQASLSTDEFATENFSSGCENDFLVIEAHWRLVVTRPHVCYLTSNLEAFEYPRNPLKL